MSACTNTTSWSLTAGRGLQVIRVGRLVMKISNVFCPLVGKSTICSDPMSEIKSIRSWLIITGLLLPVMVLVCQLMSGKFMSPAIQTVAFGSELLSSLMLEQRASM